MNLLVLEPIKMPIVIKTAAAQRNSKIKTTVHKQHVLIVLDDTNSLTIHAKYEITHPLPKRFRLLEYCSSTSLVSSVCYNILKENSDREEKERLPKANFESFAECIITNDTSLMSIKIE